MSYLSRLYNHRNAQSPDVQDKKPFFSKRTKEKDTSKNTFFNSKISNAGAGIQRLATSTEDEKLGTNDQRMERDKEDKVKAVQTAGMSPEKDKEKTIQKKDAPKEDDTLKGMHAAGMSTDKDKDKPVQKKDAAKEDDKMKGMHTAGMAMEKEKEKPVQKKDDPKKEEEKGTASTIHRKSDNNNSTTSSHVSSRIENSTEKGTALPKNTLREMNRSFGADFSNVHIHNDNEAASLNKELSAHAFTHGNDIYFNSGKYDPENNGGKHLLAHELTHVIQQNEAGEKVQRDLAIEPSNPLAQEQELTSKEIHDAIIFNNERYGQNSIQLIQDVVGAAVTGTMDEDTINLIALYQAQNGLTSDGMVGPNTFNQITSELEAEGASDKTCLNMFLVSVRTPMELHAGEKVDTANIFGHFDVELRLSPHCDCSRFEYRQFIGGDVTLNGVNINNQFSVPGGGLPGLGNFVEDGNTKFANEGRFGHRNLPTNGASLNEYVSSDGKTDMQNGCIFHSFDEPGVIGGPANSGDTYVFDFRFFGDIRKDGKMIERKFWSIRETVVIP